MPIQEQNIQFLESQVMDDVPEGGGAATGTVIIDGEMNNVFEDISDLDRTIGRFNLRKIFLGVGTLNTYLYGGSKAVITQLPDDAALGYTLFTTNDPFDTRTDAAGRVEAYLFKGPMWGGYLHENHIAGMMAINLIQRVGTALPPIGRTLALVQDEGTGSEKEQYVRVTQVTTTVATFTDAQGDYERWVVTLSLSDALRTDFNGHSVSRAGPSSYASKTRIRDTTVADAARYYSTQKLAETAAIGDLSVKAQSQFTQLVPSAATETPLVDQVLNPDRVQVLNAGTRTVEVPQVGHTLALPVTPENRRLNWIQTLLPIPAPDTLTWSYRAQGNWFTLLEADGIIAGSDPGFGAGTLNFSTGTASITLGALPDAGSQIMAAWASPIHYVKRSGGDAVNDAFISVPIQLDNLPAIPESITLAWSSGSVAKTATVSSTGVISGDGTGSIDPITGVGELRLTQLPDRGTPLTIAYDWLEGESGDTVLRSITIPFVANMTTAEAITPGTLRVRILTGTTLDVNAVSTPAGDLVVLAQRIIIQSGWSVQVPEQTIGTVNHATGAIDITATTVSYTANASYSSTTGWATGTLNTSIAFGGDTSVVYRNDTVTPLTQSAQDTPDMEELTFRLTPNQTDDIVTNSIRVVLGGRTYDDNNGTLISGGNNLPSGSVDYTTGDCTLTFWDDGAVLNPNVTSLLTRYGQWPATEASFRSAISPLAPESVSLVATTMDGEQITGTSDPDGVIVGDVMQGAVNYEFGTATVEFGAYGPDPEHEGGGTPATVWIPREVDPGSIRYNAVSFRYIPLDADILGIDAVRLPSDGRVPIYRAGNVIMIMHAQTTDPVTPTQDTPVSLGRTRIAWVRVMDDNGDTVTEDYTLDRDNGTVTFTTVPTHTPVTIRHTVADLRLCTDAQINGQITISQPLTHLFPANESLVASCLLFGDRRARVENVFDQQTWSNVWSDSLSGNTAPGTLNLIDFPITVTNEGTDTDRWAFIVVNASTNQWRLVSEKRGQVWTGTYAPGGDDVAPINPRTRVWDEQSQTWVGGTPYMTIPGLANGGGWATGNVVRINTVGAISDFWIARSIQQSESPAGAGLDGCEMYALGNIDRPEA